MHPPTSGNAKRKHAPPSQEKIRQNLNYNKDSGVFTWKIKTMKCQIGDTAGYLNLDGYLSICINGLPWLAHRLVWLYVHGVFPDPVDQVDHINGTRTDNRLENLRLVRSRENNQNRSIHRDGDLPGANWDKVSRKWRARAYVNRRRYQIGMFDTAVEAHEAYKTFLKEKFLEDDYILDDVGFVLGRRDSSDF